VGSLLFFALGPGGQCVLAIIMYLATLVAILWRKASQGDGWSLCGIGYFCLIDADRDQQAYLYSMTQRKVLRLPRKRLSHFTKTSDIHAWDIHIRIKNTE